MNAPVDSVSPGTAAAGGPDAAPPWWTTLTAKVVLSYPFTGPGLPVWGLVALLAAVPYGSLLEGSSWTSG